MPRKLRTYQTSLGFFDLAVAAPSMKAALEAWGSKANLFHQGFAMETGDTAIVEATMAKPGVVLRRPVGSKGVFTEHAKLPKHLPAGKGNATQPKPRSEKRRPTSRKRDDKAARAAVISFEKERKRRERERRREETALAKDRERRARAVDKAEQALEAAKRAHEKRMEFLEKGRAALESRLIAEEERWTGQKGKLGTALDRARGD